jgi:acyl-[acyl-carrier-protein]-phospholipid O-acyltransferase/long-chain-fatty-acid--[acyl-carrier-protein] ligase
MSLTLLAQKNYGLIVSLASGLYVAPYLLFSPIGGRLAKTHRKSAIMFWSKVFELPFFILSCVGFMLHSLYIVLFCIFAVGLISTLFSPSKYGLIRDIGGDEGISFGTGTLEMFTFFGVLLAMFIAGIIADHYTYLVFSSIVVGLSLIQIVISKKLSKIEEAKTIEVKNDTLNPIKFVVQSFKWGKTITHSNLIILGLATFWMLGSLITMNLMTHCNNVLKMTKTETGIVTIISSIGIGLGSYITGVLSQRKVNLGFTPIGAFGMMLCFASLYVFDPRGINFSVTIFITSFFCGMYMVPLSSWVQHSVEGRLQGDMLAYSNFVIFLLIVISAVLFSPAVELVGTNGVWLLMFVIVLSVLLVMMFNVKEMGQSTRSLFKK